ncbi:hypothetical protein EKG38_09415 [Shewanella canadensis]|uniref:Uncharacterized protein n=1 Tax=Shewanella canadensis TaxID=271096 RepID=A0A3S0L1G1_9GAMM|nr:hypothetical protein [Shewanella canadensis]RTR39134.1 hypothetical protein EKG38_09415 [Shewanella canadensis]
MKIHYLPGILLLLAGCSLQAQDLRVSEASPALLSDSSTDSKAELQHAIASLLKAEEVLIADDAFMQSSRLSLSRAPHTDPSGQLIMGRNFEMPDVVQLFIQGEQCFVYHEESDQHRPLPLSKCIAE